MRGDAGLNHDAMRLRLRWCPVIALLALPGCQAVSHRRLPAGDGGDQCLLNDLLSLEEAHPLCRDTTSSTTQTTTLTATTQTTTTLTTRSTITTTSTALSTTFTDSPGNAPGNETIDPFGNNATNSTAFSTSTTTTTTTTTFTSQTTTTISVTTMETTLTTTETTETTLTTTLTATTTLPCPWPSCWLYPSNASACDAVARGGSCQVAPLGNPCVDSSGGTVALSCSPSGVMQVIGGGVMPRTRCRPCSVAPRWVDFDLRADFVEGRLRFGQSLLDGAVIDGSTVIRYRIYAVDRGLQKLGSALAEVEASSRGGITCCHESAYEVRIMGVLPANAERLMVVAVAVGDLELPVGSVTGPIVDFDGEAGAVRAVTGELLLQVSDGESPSTSSMAAAVVGLLAEATAMPPELVYADVLHSQGDFFVAEFSVLTPTDVVQSEVKLSLESMSVPSLLMGPPRASGVVTVTSISGLAFAMKQITTTTTATTPSTTTITTITMSFAMSITMSTTTMTSEFSITTNSTNTTATMSTTTDSTTSTTGALTTATTTTTRTFTSTTTVTERSTFPPTIVGEPMHEVKGVLQINVNNAQAFATDPVAVEAVRRTIGNQAGVSHDQVAVELWSMLSLSSGERRLEAARPFHRGTPRLLSAGIINAEYTISIASSLSSQVAGRLMTAGGQTLGSALQAELHRVSPSLSSAYTVQVLAISATVMLRPRSQGNASLVEDSEPEAESSSGGVVVGIVTALVVLLGCCVILAASRKCIAELGGKEEASAPHEQKEPEANEEAPVEEREPEDFWAMVPSNHPQSSQEGGLTETRRQSAGKTVVLNVEAAGMDSEAIERSPVVPKQPSQSPGSDVALAVEGVRSGPVSGLQAFCGSCCGSSARGTTQDGELCTNLCAISERPTAYSTSGVPQPALRVDAPAAVSLSTSSRPLGDPQGDLVTL